VEQEAWQVLIVEDDQRLAELTREYLESNGLRVAIEGDGGLAAARIIAEQPDLVILDLMLPGEDGLSICRKVRDQYDGPILMLTARTDDLDVWATEKVFGSTGIRQEKHLSFLAVWCLGFDAKPYM